MWICKKCGESIEDQFDSCWHCAPQEISPSQGTSSLPVKTADYFFAALVAYTVPFAGLFVSGFDLDVELFRLWGAWAWMTGPGAVSFFVLRFFLERPVSRWLVLVAFGLGGGLYSL